jgi:hypothetical protein
LREKVHATTEGTTNALTQCSKKKKHKNEGHANNNITKSLKAKQMTSKITMSSMKMWPTCSAFSLLLNY